MMKFFLTGLLISTTFLVFGQKADAIIHAKEVERIERILSADEMMGRKALTPFIDKAADFISDEFKKAGLLTMNGNSGYRQEFAMVHTKFISASGAINGVAVNPDNVLAFTSQQRLTFNHQSGFEKVLVKTESDLQKQRREAAYTKNNLLVIVDKSLSTAFNGLAYFKRSNTRMENKYSVVFILSGSDPATYDMELIHEVSVQKFANITGILPGKSKKDEYVIFSAHYDHIGVGRPVNGDSIFNGANDNASGTTALIMLARYYSKNKNNDRTIVFAAFTGEEMGLYGSDYFSRNTDTAKTIAMINIEMIGTKSKWGGNSVFLTGHDKSGLFAILKENLMGSSFKIYPDPYPTARLFYRSDNASLARFGVPAHSISTAKMDDELHYHKESDEVETLDLENMTRIIQSIALASRSIVAGKDTPTRVKAEELRK